MQKGARVDGEVNIEEEEEEEEKEAKGRFCIPFFLGEEEDMVCRTGGGAGNGAASTISITCGGVASTEIEEADIFCCLNE